jgi:hypothetical protein
MDSLPDELLLYIFRFLELDSLYFMVMVSNFYNNFVKKNIKFICNNNFITTQRLFFNENLYFNRFFFTLNELNTSFNLVFIRKDYLEDPRYDKYYEMEACKRGFQFYRDFKYLKDNNLLGVNCYRVCQSLNNIQMTRLVKVKKAGFLETHALIIAEKFNDKQIEDAIKMRNNDNMYEYMIIEKISSLSLDSSNYSNV